jgi:membrane associated rhomboid family serine protease
MSPPVMSWEALAILYAVCSSFWVGRMLVHRASPTPKRFPTATTITATLVALGLILQLAFPTLLGWMQRNTGRIGTGEVWRVVTALFFQDGGLSGGVFNLTCLALVGPVTERFWGSRRWLLIYFGCGMVGELLALIWQPLGAGNSIATLALSGSLFARGSFRPGLNPVHLLCWAGLLTGVALILTRNIHGTAIILGAISAIP